MSKRQRNFKESIQRLSPRLEPYVRAKNKARFRARGGIRLCESSSMKVIHATYNEALEASMHIFETRGATLRAYPCNDHYHLTSRL